MTTGVWDWISYYLVVDRFPLALYPTKCKKGLVCRLASIFFFFFPNLVFLSFFFSVVLFFLSHEACNVDR